uniref:Uncharacterized protein n=1 Tax=Anopheles albimanus TaxID=7167 RepID=A0A182FGI7_ANOAL
MPASIQSSAGVGLPGCEPLKKTILRTGQHQFRRRSFEMNRCVAVLCLLAVVLSPSDATFHKLFKHKKEIVLVHPPPPPPHHYAPPPPPPPPPVYHEPVQTHYAVSYQPVYHAVSVPAPQPQPVYQAPAPAPVQVYHAPAPAPAPAPVPAPAPAPVHMLLLLQHSMLRLPYIMLRPPYSMLRLRCSILRRPQLLIQSCTKLLHPSMDHHRAPTKNSSRPGTLDSYG